MYSTNFNSIQPHSTIFYFIQDSSNKHTRVKIPPSSYHSTDSILFLLFVTSTCTAQPARLNLLALIVHIHAYLRPNVYDTVHIKHLHSSTSSSDELLVMHCKPCPAMPTLAPISLPTISPVHPTCSASR